MESTNRIASSSLRIIIIKIERQPGRKRITNI